MENIRTANKDGVVEKTILARKLPQTNDNSGLSINITAAITVYASSNCTNTYKHELPRNTSRPLQRYLQTETRVDMARCPQ
jgi:hypothetical protein